MADVLFVVDGPWYLHRAAYTLNTRRDDIGGALARHFLSIVCNDAMAVRATHILIAFDGDKVFRHDIFAGYKSGRSGGPSIKSLKDADVNSKKAVSIEADDENEGKEIYSYLPKVFRLLTGLGIPYFQPNKHEADDVLCSVGRKYGPKIKVVCGTQDKDAYQYLEHDGSIVLYDGTYKDPKTQKTVGRFITAKLAEKLKGVRIDQMVDYQTIMGDSGDDVPGIPGYGPVRTAAVLNKYGSLKNWRKKGTDAERTLLAQNQARLIINRKMVKLVDTILPPLKLKDMRLEKLSDTKLEKYRPPTAFNKWYRWVHPKSKGLFSRLGK